MNQPSRRLEFIPELNGVRAFAVLSVMCGHAAVPGVNGGGVGVDIFFVLSGYLITSILLREFYSSGSISLKNFYLRRVLRLAPALLLFLAIAMAIMFFMLPREETAYNAIDAVVAMLYLTNWSRGFGIHPPHYFAHLWSLSLEEQFYLLWPGLLLLMLRHVDSHRRILRITIGLAVLCWFSRIYIAYTLADTHVAFIRFYHDFESRADSILTGSAIAIWIGSRPLDDVSFGTARKWLSVAAIPCAFGLFSMVLFMAQLSQLDAYVSYTAVELLTGVLIMNVLLRRDSVIPRLLGARWVVWIGSISYGLYLWHWPIFYGMRLHYFSWYQVMLYGGGVSVAVSAVSFYFIERPFLALKDRMPRRSAATALQRN